MLLENTPHIDDTPASPTAPGSTPITAPVSFADLGLAAPLLHALVKAGYTTPTPIQAQAIPTLLTGRDLLGIAQTGTGKTAAFALPILHRMAARRVRPVRNTTRCLVLSPTRELAGQIAENFKAYGAGMGFIVTTVFGGVGYAGQIRALSGGVDVLVATPGRLIDHIKAGHLKLGLTEFLVLDEVDQMLDLGFLQPIRSIARDLPAERQNLFFSATMPTEIGKLASELLRDPVRVSVAPVATTAAKVTQHAIVTEASNKRRMLLELFANPAIARAIVFTRTKRGADKVAEMLDGAGVRTEAIHGNKSQGQRERALRAFRDGGARALVATDIAARGIDVDGVTHVINYEMPDEPERYVHRIGRTARAGAEGIAIALVSPDELGALRQIEKLTRQSITLQDRRDHDSVPLEQLLPVPGDGRAKRGGPRPSGVHRADPRVTVKPHGGRGAAKFAGKPRGQSRH